MKLYLDLVLIINFFFDFILLLSTGIVLKRIISIKKIVVGAFIGSLSILLLFYNINNIELFIYKIVFSIIMIILSYPKLDIKYIFYNLLIFYIISFFLGGVLYALNISFSYRHVKMVFIDSGYGISYVYIIILSPIVLYLYIKEQNIIKNKYHNYYSVKIFIEQKVIEGVGYLDSGNNLTYKRRPVILIDERKVIFSKENYRIIPYKVVNRVLMLKIYKCQYIEVNNKKIKGVYVGISNEGFGIDGIDILLNNKLLEDI